MGVMGTDRFRSGRWLRWTVVAALLLVVGAASAEQRPADDDPFDRPGLYLGLSGVYTHNLFEGEIEDFLSDELGADIGVDIDDSQGINARLGYRALSWFAAELQYEWIDSYEVSGSAVVGGNTFSGNLYDIGGHTLTLNTKWIVPFWRVQPYLLLGAGYSFYDVDRGVLAGVVEALDNDIDIGDGGQSGFAGRGGLGLDLYLSRNVVLTTEATVLLTTDDFEAPDEGAIDNLYYLSLSAGLQYRF
jgi:opacity protein-like surface antigen